MTGSSLDLFRGLSLDAQAVVDELCSEFEQAWLGGDPPALEAYLERVAPAHQAALLAELLAMEVEVRRNRGEDPSAGEYAKRFPDLGSVVRRVFADAPSPAPTVRTGLPTVPGYEVTAELGRGGMGVVYRARHLALNRPVALKMLRTDGLASLEERVRFRLEAEAVAALRHPNIVQVYEAGEADGQPYLALELVGGGSLDRLTGTPVPPRRAAQLVEALARAVHFAHARGVVHRDLKPANVLLADDDPDAPPTPKVTDFGLAQRTAADARRTQAGVVVGTPAYMAPEQADPDGPPVGPVADVYALGVVLYELLTGAVPHKGRSTFDTLVLVRTREPVPPRRANPAVPRDLDTVVLKCLEKDPAQRYESAAALADDLWAWLDGRPVAARPVGPTERAWKWARRRPALAAALSAVAALLVVVAVVSAVAVARLDQRHTELLAERARAGQAEDARRAALAESLLTAAPDSVPFIADALAPSADAVRPVLRAEFDAAASPARRLRAAVGLTLLGEPQANFLLATVPAAPAAESRNLVRGIRAARTDTIINRLRAAAALEPDLARRARHAVLLLDLGEPDAAAAMLAGGPDPTPRTALVDEFRGWHGDLTGLPAVLRGPLPPDARSGLCLAIGGVDPDTLAADVRSQLTAVLADLYRDAPDAGTHAAAGWALRQWGAPQPELPRGPGPAAGRGWFVNGAGVTMVAVPTGAFVPGPSTAVVLTRPYHLADREVPAGLYRQFLADPSHPDGEAPGAWTAAVPSPDCPAVEVPRDDTVRFCNWLSGREGRRPCYRRGDAGEWVCDFAADGYRLPTEAEWDNAHRAGAATAFAFADDPRWLADYAHVASRRSAPGGSKRPNRWGLFDTAGNVWELCWDQYDVLPAGLLVDPVGPSGAGPWVTRGGAFDSGAYDTGLDFRFRGDGRGRTTGFRVACTAAGAAGAGPADLREQLRLFERIAEQYPQSLAAARVRAGFLARRGRWADAAAGYARAWALAPEEHDLAYRGGVLLLMAGDEAGYREHVRAFLRAFGGTRHRILAERTAKACLLAPLGEDDLAAVVPVAVFAVEEAEPAWLDRYATLARGLAAYRAGDYPSALDWLGRGREPGPHPVSREADALAGFVQAMALRRLGRAAEARAAFDHAAGSMADDFRRVRDGDLGGNWHDVLMAWVVAREAEGVLAD